MQIATSDPPNDAKLTPYEVTCKDSNNSGVTKWLFCPPFARRVSTIVWNPFLQAICNALLSSNVTVAFTSAPLSRSLYNNIIQRSQNHELVPEIRRVESMSHNYMTQKSQKNGWKWTVNLNIQDPLHIMHAPEPHPHYLKSQSWWIAAQEQRNQWTNKPGNQTACSWHCSCSCLRRTMCSSHLVECLSLLRAQLQDTNTLLKQG